MFDHSLMSRFILGAATGFWFATSGAAMAQTPPDVSIAKPAPTVETCRILTDRVARLECFDTVFNVVIPSPPPDPPVFPVEAKPAIIEGPIRTIAHRQEQGRVAEQKGWLTRVRPWKEEMFFSLDNFADIRRSAANQEPQGTVNAHRWTNETTDVFLTLSENSVAAGFPDKNLSQKAVLMATCENKITSLYAVLPTPISNPRAKVTLSSDRGTVFTANWRDVEQGYVIGAGRGLESIDFLKSIASFKRVQLQLQDEQGSRSFVFDIENLSAKLSPLRTACRW